MRAMRDFMRDAFKNACGFPVDLQIMQIDFRGADVHMSEHLLCPARVFKMGSHEMAQAMGRKKGNSRFRAQTLHKVLDARRGPWVGQPAAGGFKNIPFIVA